jgi:hypothetical protein
MEVTTNPPTHDLVIRRIIDAPVEMVWKMWTDREHVMGWWGPQFYTSPTCKIDLRPGGRCVFCMRAPADVSCTRNCWNSPSISPTRPGTLSLRRIYRPDFLRPSYTRSHSRPRGMTELTIVEYAWPISHMIMFSYAGMHQSLDKLSDLVTQPVAETASPRS